MKSFLIGLIAFILSVPALAQDLALLKLQKLREMELPKVDRKLKKKG